MCYCGNMGVERIPKYDVFMTGCLTLMCDEMFVAGCLTLMCDYMFVAGCLTLKHGDMFVAGCLTLRCDNMFVAGCLTFHRQRSTQKTWMPSSVEKSQCHKFFFTLIV